MDFTSILEALNGWIIYIAILPLLISAYALGYALASHRVRHIINRARRAGGVNFGEAAAIEITSFTTTNLWLYSFIIILSIAAAAGLIWIGVA